MRTAEDIIHGMPPDQRGRARAVARAAADEAVLGAASELEKLLAADDNNVTDTLLRAWIKATRESTGRE